MGLLFFAAPLLGQVSNPTVVFSSPGTKQVTLQACNPTGCDTVTKSVVVLDPLPWIVSVASLPARVLAGQGVSLSAQSTGRPPLTHRWLITWVTGSVTLTENPTTWNTASPGIGAYQVRLEVQNAEGSVFSTPVAVLVVAPGIFSDGFESGGSLSWAAQSPR